MNVSTYGQRIAELARDKPELCFTALNHNMDADWLREAFGRVRKDAAPGVDGQSAEAYGEHLAENLRDLEGRAHTGSYFAPPAKRVHIPKGTGQETRPIGIPTVEDKVLQRAVAMLLEPIYEQDFLPCSYGFRPGRSAHQALDALWKGIMNQGGGWILEVDIEKFFDTLELQQLRAFLDRRVRDGVIRRLIGKWLKAGVLEDGRLHYPQRGSPQGGVLSPLLSNIYLHYVLDTWFETEVRPRLKGRTLLVRYADDFVIGFQSRTDAERVQAVLPKRFAKYGLSLHPTKTRLVPFSPPLSGGGQGHGKPGTFDFLGFTHYWGRSRKGRWIVKRKTMRKRFTRALQRLTEWCRTHRHYAVSWQHRGLCAKLHGHMAYYGITGNGLSLKRFVHEAARIWRKWLQRRSRAGGGMTWDRFARLLRRYPLPPVRIVHSVLTAKP